MPSYKSCLNDNMSGSRRLLSPTTSSGDTAFPWKLHKVLEEATWHGFTEVISWQGNNAFKVHDPIAFEESIMKRYFNQTQYKSFQRQRKYNIETSQTTITLPKRPRLKKYCSLDSLSTYWYYNSQHLWLWANQTRRQGHRMLHTSSLYSGESWCLQFHDSNQGQEEG